MDEPTNGLDPNQIIEVRKLIKEIAQERSVLLSTHILSEVQATCDNIIMVEHGVIVFADTLHAFNNYIEPDSLIMVVEGVFDTQRLHNIPGVEKVEVLHDERIRIHFSTGPDITKDIIKACVENGWPLTEIFLEKSSLDGIFAQLSKKN